jgi:NodT family efflux transporter outer membrane factor (OMF) lipoprotein
MVLGLSACAVGPDYVKPSLELPDQWRAEEGWKVATPQDEMMRSAWWDVYGDEQLNHLEQQALTQNAVLQIAQSRLEQSKSQTTVAMSSLLPQLSLQSGASRFQTSADRPLAAYTTPNQQVQQNDYNTALAVNYEIDLSGRNRRRLEAAQAGQAQAVADFESTRLMLTAQLAADYFALQQLDADIALLQELEQAQQRAMTLINIRYETGMASAMDVDAYHITLNSTRTLVLSLKDQRSHFENAIATLVGTDAPRFHLAVKTEVQALAAVPDISLVQPSVLLERRPDVASAERAMAVANAQIGIAKSAYFPTLNLAALAGSDANSSPLLFAARASSLWSIGLSGTQTLFDAGKTSAAVDMAQAGYQQSVSAYRQTVLSAFEEVQNILSSLNTLKQSQPSFEQSRQSAWHTYDTLKYKYTLGTANALDVTLAQQNWIANERLMLQNRTQLLLTSVQLTKALGGGWSAPAVAR